MVARLVKNLKAERRRVPPVGAIEADLNALWVADASDVRTAPLGGVETQANELDRLYAALQAVTPQAHPRTARLLSSSTRKVAQKVIEEAGEVALATVKHNSRGIVHESADLLYHLAVLWRRAGLDPAAVWGEMRRRADSLGIAEKLPKSKA
jgi:phosphoribosyl-ATP pyrophosphohydrolase